jgi:MFS family permease
MMTFQVLMLSKRRYVQLYWHNCLQTIVSIALLGAAIGSMIVGPLSDKYGRKIITMLADFLFTIGAIVMAFAPSIFVLICGRLIVGVRILVYESI